jgi:hypothetical protein
MAAARGEYENPEDRSHRAHTLHTTFSAAQELIVAELRRLLELPLDDLLVVTRRFINSEVSRSGLNRLLQREGLCSLRALRAARAKAAEEKYAAVNKKGFKEYAPGFIHIDIKYLLRMPDETSRRYLFVAIDRASRWVFLHIYDDQSEKSSLDFLKRLQAAWSDSHSHNPDGQRHTIHRPLHFPAKAAFRQSRLRPGLRQRSDRPSPYSSTPSPDKRHGRTLQWLHQRTLPADPLRERRRT